MNTNTYYDSQEFVPLVTYPNYLDALAVKDALDERSLNCFIRNDSATAAIMGSIIWGEFTVMVSSSQKYIALDVLNSLFDLIVTDDNSQLPTNSDL